MANKSTWQKVKGFLRGVKLELKKVNWINKNELFSYTLVVIVAVLLLSAFIGGVDQIFSNLIVNFILN